MKGISVLVPLIIVLIAAALVIVVLFTKYGTFSTTMSVGECWNFILQKCNEDPTRINNQTLDQVSVGNPIETQKLISCTKNFWSGFIEIEEETGKEKFDENFCTLIRDYPNGYS
ncbi:MAG: hypothetical protein B6U78_00365 [Candidatus Aenigmarchaeota archaeon ex4484_224]|nr:MAG: hypothetical protein B6U78_00365 [Candidatus Aenigmarchaeota archaeon ex4484_224]